jgi:hypothetical protein
MKMDTGKTNQLQFNNEKLKQKFKKEKGKIKAN